VCSAALPHVLSSQANEYHMSKIAKALEKAKLEHEHTPAEMLRAPLFHDNHAQRTAAHEPIVYTKTKVIPSVHRDLERFRILTALDDPKLIDTYSLLRTKIMSKTKDQGKTTLMITSATPNEGKTTTAINLSLSFARHAQQTALLVDMDLRSPDISTYLGLERHAGLTDYLVKDTPLDSLLIHPEGMQDIVVLPAGQSNQGSTDLLGTPKMQSLVRELKTRYTDRYVIFDCPSLVDNPDALIFSSYVDAIILVVEADRAPKEKIQKAIEMLGDKEIVGLVMNKAAYTH
ncbi:MAG: polysaccharide biosynthesis tyrosine autokinase, partial [Desulfoplanes sp.]|nr:polysaccharide biosynthesis tyrosine autokinase [Desulfoplanes sp.]